MTLGELIRRLRSEGFSNAVRHRIHRAIENERIVRPPVDGAGNFIFGPRQLAQLRRHLAEGPKRGRPKKPA